MKKIKILGFAFALFFCVSTFAQTTIMIGDADGLQNMSANGEYQQNANITLTTSGNLMSEDFTGTYDGNGKTITINVSNATFSPLFASNSGTIKNLNIKIQGTILTSGNVLAVLVGTNTGTIENCTVEGISFIKTDMSAGESLTIGGLVGLNNGDGLISRCTAKSSIMNVTTTSNGNIGGLVGTLNGGTIQYSSFDGGDAGIVVTPLSSTDIYAGGIVGKVNDGTINACYVSNAGIINATSASSVKVGGITSEVAESSFVERCYSDFTNGLQVAANNTTGTYSYCCYNDGNGNVKQYPNGETLANTAAVVEYLNTEISGAGEIPAFILSMDGTEATLNRAMSAMGDYSTCESGNFTENIWTANGVNNVSYSPTLASSVTLNHKVTVNSGESVYLKAATINNGGVLEIKKGGNVVLSGRLSKTVVDDIASLRVGYVLANGWNFIGFPNNNNASPLASISGDIWAVDFDYGSNAWSEEYLHWVEGNLDAQSEIPYGTGIFAYAPDEDMVLYSSSLKGIEDYTEDNFEVTRLINGDTEYGRWMALANPYLGALDVAAFLREQSNVQGENVIYVFDGESFQNPETVAVGQGFFVNMVSNGQNTINFSSNQIKNFPASTSAKSVASREYVKVSVSTDGYKVPVMICQNELAGQEYDIFDANKMFGNGNVAEPYFVTEGINLCKEEVATMPYYATMNIKSGEARRVEIVADAIPEGYSATLIDGEEEIELTEGMVYTTDIASGDNAERFKLLIGEKNVSLESAEAIDNLIQVSNVGRRVNISARGAIEAEVYNALGQKVYTTTNNSFTLDGVSAGAYIIKVSNGKSVKSAKIIVQ